MSTLEKILPDDPRLTAYALGEMDPAERAEFETRLKQDAAGRALVAEINRAAHRIGVALASEEVAVASAGSLDQAAIIPGRDRGVYDGGPLRAGDVPNVRRGLATMLRFPQLYFTISGLAAACFAIGFIIWQAGYRPPQETQYMVVDLTKLPPASTAKSTKIAGNEAEPAGSFQTIANESADGVTSFDEGGKDNAFVAVVGAPVSTFPIKVGTAAYSHVRDLIESGRRPAREAVRIEEMVNYFPYHYAASAGLADGTRKNEGGTHPFAAYLEVASAPWAPEHRLVRIGLKGREMRNVATASTEGGPHAIAKNVTILVEFNPAQVQSYRLIGYENRRLHAEENSPEKIDAGEILAGHAVTALYEILPVRGAGLGGMAATDAAQSRTAGVVVEGGAGDLLTLKVNYRELGGALSSKCEFPLRDAGQAFDVASADFKFAVSVAAFGMILRDSPHKGEATLAHVTEWAQAGLGKDAGGYRAEFVGLVGQAGRLSPN